MGINYFISILCAIVSLSPVKDKEPKMMAAQFTLYIDSNAYADGELVLTWESKIDRKVYKNDCWGLHDLSTFMGEICDPRELYELNRILEEFRGQKKETPNYNKL